MTLVIGTRGSPLALAQARLVSEALGPDTELRVIRTSGDDTDRPLAELGDGAFVGALEEALRRGEIDVAVHSLKDLPTQERTDLVVAAIPQREDPRDALIGAEPGGLAALGPGAVIGTSSPRRAAFLGAMRPDVTAREIRGNVGTRLRKVREREYDGVVLAVAGMRRLGLEVSPSEALDPVEWPPAPGQGALAVQCRSNDAAVLARLGPLDHGPTRLAVETERALLRGLGATCLLPLGGYARAEGDEVILDAAIAHAGQLVRVRARGANSRAVAADAVAQFRRLGAVTALAGRVVVLTRQPEDNRELRDLLRLEGATVLELPCVRTEDIADTTELKAAVQSLGQDDVLVLTSRAGARAIAGLAPIRASVAAVGDATAGELQSAGIPVSFTPSEPNGIALGRELTLPPGLVLLARSNLAAADLPEMLASRGARVRETVAYQTVVGASADPEPVKRALLEGGQSATVVLSSLSAVDGLLEALGAETLAQCALVAIGPATAAQVRVVIGREPIVAARPDAAAVLEAVRAGLPN